jgi:hypothetical protein
MSVGTKLTAKKREKFLKRLAETANISLSCRLVGISRDGIYDLKAKDAEFATAWLSAIEAGVENLEAEAYRRAHKGVNKPVFYQGVECGKVKEYSDTLAIFLLKGAKPEKYRERVDVRGEIEQRVRFCFGKKKVGKKKTDA